MTHLLATLLTGIQTRVTTRIVGKQGSGTAGNEGSGFEEVLRGQPDGSRETANDDPVRQAGEDPRATEGRHAGEHRTPTEAGSAADDPAATGQASSPGVTLLGGSFGPRVRVPALTFMLPAGAGPEDMAAAIRTQVLRFTATRQLDPGSLDNLRIAISSRELGQVEVDLSARGEKLDVEIVTAGREAETVIRKTSGELRESLLARTDRFRQVDVKVSTRSGQDEESPERDFRRESGQRRDAWDDRDGGNPEGASEPDQTEDGS